MKPFDFDKNFQNYVKNWAVKNGKLTAEQMEEEVPKLYEQWVNTPFEKELTVKQYFKNMSGGELADYLKTVITQGYFPPEVLLNEISDRKCEKELLPLLKEENEKLVLTAAELLDEMGCEADFSEMLNFVTECKCGEKLRIHACFHLGKNPAKVYEMVRGKLSTYSVKAKEYLADILCEMKEEEVFALLKELLLSQGDTALFAYYLGKHGDKRALPLLKEMLLSEEIGYLAYQEIKNAIERLGEFVETERDFSSDPEYQMIKLSDEGKSILD